MEYVSKACPFCGGTQIDLKNGTHICAYCLQPLDISNGKLSDGFNKLASYNFAGAAAFFRSMTDACGAEAYYGLFLAQNKIEENRGKTDIRPVVYAYRPQSFKQDGDYMALQALCAENSVLTEKLAKIEQARASMLTPAVEYDVLAFFDAGTVDACKQFADALTEKGYRVLRSADFTSPDVATLRCAGAVYAFASQTETVQKLVQSGVARAFALLENAQTNDTGLPKKPMKLVSGVAVPDLLLDGIRDAVDVCAELSYTAELRRLSGLRTASGTVDVPLARSASSVNVSLKSRATEPVAETENEKADLGRMQRSLSGGDFADVAKQFEKLTQKGCGNSRMFWYAYLALSKTRNDEEYVFSADASAFSPRAVAVCDQALYRCASDEEAKPYVNTLVGAALRLIDRKKTEWAAKALDTAFTYDCADAYASAVLNRLDAAKSGLGTEAYFSLYKKVLEKMRSADAAFKLERLCKVIDYALLCGDYARADDWTEGALYEYPRASALYLRKVLCENKAADFAAVLEKEYPRLGEPFICYMATLPPAASAKTLHDAFGVLLQNARARGFEKYGAALDEILFLGQMEQFAQSGRQFGAADYCAAGEAALRSGDFDAAGAYYTHAISLDKNSYEAYWGALKATLRCKTDVQLEECDTPVDEAGNYYANAYKTAYGVNDAFLEKAESVRARQRQVEKKNGHVFRKDDFVMADGKLVQYTGNSERVFVGGGIFRIGANAFRGSTVKSVLVGESVNYIDDGAFAYSQIERIVLPSSLRGVGVNPFRGCDRLTQVESACPRIFTEGGCVYAETCLVAYLPAVAGAVVTVAPNTTEIGKCAFYGAGAVEVRLPASVRKTDVCAFYGCEGALIRGGALPETRSLAGETAFGDCARENGRLMKNDTERWVSLYGGGNNMAVEAATETAAVNAKENKSRAEKERQQGCYGRAVKECRQNGYGRAVKLFDTVGKINGGMLVKNGKVFYTSGKTLYAASLDDALAGKITTPVCMTPLPGNACGTGVLWNEYIVQPVERDRCTLLYIDPAGKIDFTVKIGFSLTRPLALCGNTLLCPAGDRLFAVDLPSGKVTERVMPEKLTAVPCVLQNKFLVAGERNMYMLSPSLTGDAVYCFKGVPYAQGSGKILKGRVVAYNGIAYWIERSDSQIHLAAFDGQKVRLRAIPRKIADFMQTQPVFAQSRFYGGATKTLVTAEADPAAAEWNFRVLRALDGKFAEIAVCGEAPYVNYMEGENGNLRLRAVYKTHALLCDIVKGGVYGARI